MHLTKAIFGKRRRQKPSVDGMALGVNPVTPPLGTTNVISEENSKISRDCRK